MSEFRALLLTDVFDSTKLAEELGDARMAELWAAHDRGARSLLVTWRGREIDKTDGMLMLFDGAADAVPYALAYHRMLAELPVPLRARVGLHVGPVLLRENSPEDIARGAKPLEVDGLAKPTAARVMTLALPGQTLMTTEARDSLGQTVLKFVSHGHWMVKGVSDPLELFEIGEPHTRFAQPPDSEKAHRVVRAGDWWMPVRDIPHNLPYQATSFLGRERELGEVKALLGSARLVTLLGMGGLGKTRLSLQVAAELIHQFPDGVWFLDLASIRDPALVLGETAQVIGVREEPDRPLLQTICAHLASRRTLIIMDNCEHLIHAAAELANSILKAAPHVRLLASSREALRTPGEQAYPVLPLPLPGKGEGLADLLRSTSVRLFVDRAQLHKPSFVLTEREGPIVAELVARLEGIPLALELAAARMRSLTVADINVRLQDRYKLLTGGARVLQERQQTLRALVDWSYELLEEKERTVLNRMGVFIGGFDLAAAEAVCADEVVSSDDVLDLLSSLVEKSLVSLDERDEGARYRMLETIREYAHDKLEKAGEVVATSVRHCEHYFAMLKVASRGLRGPQQAEWIWRIEADLDNVRTATAFPLARGTDPFIAVKFAVALQGFWTLRGYSSEGRKVVKAALSMPEIQASDMAQAWALYVGAALAEMQSDHVEARQMLETCLTLRRRLNNAVDIAATLSTLSLARLHAGDALGARAGETEALEIFRTLNDRIGEALGLLHLGQTNLYLGDDLNAKVMFDQCLTIARDIKHQVIEGECELMLGETAFEAGDSAQAKLRMQRSMTVCRDAGDKRGEANALRQLGRLDVQEGAIASASNRLDDAVRAFRSFEMWDELLNSLEDCARLAWLNGRVYKAVRLAAALTTSRARLQLVRSPRDQHRWQSFLAVLREATTPVDHDEAWQEGQQWQIDRAIRNALSPEDERITA